MKCVCERNQKGKARQGKAGSKGRSISAVGGGARENGRRLGSRALLGVPIMQAHQAAEADVVALLPAAGSSSDPLLQPFMSRPIATHSESAGSRFHELFLEMINLCASFLLAARVLFTYDAVLGIAIAISSITVY